MKAVIMAGGDGTRLRPLSANKPKPMVELLDKPVLEHILELLKRHGVTEACLTLKYLPQLVTDYFGNGEKFGMRLDYRIEKEALGTAGGVLNCADFLSQGGAEDFLVISGDCYCDFDLGALAAFHKEKGAEATLGLYSHPEPCEFGLVVTAEDGRVVRFIEKPAWDSVLTDQINTGIYVLSPSVLQEIPKGKPYDFGRELFPRLLGDNRGMFGLALPGHWCDIGSTNAYLRCCRDMLRGSRSTGALPEGVQLVPPVYIGENAVIGKGAVIGPDTVIGAGSVIAAGARVRGSVVNGAAVNENAVVDGAVICAKACVGRGTEVSEGAVIGENCQIGEGCVIAAGTRIWPDRQIPSGALVSGIVAGDNQKAGLTFARSGVIRGEAGVTVTADACLRLGAAAGEFRRVGVGWHGGETARVMAEAFGCGVCAAGGDLLRHDGNFLSCASYAGQVFGLPLSVFFEERKDGVAIEFMDGNGGKIKREAERKFEAAAAEPHRAGARTYGSAATVMGVVDAYVSAAVKNATVPAAVPGTGGGFAVSVAGKGAENRALKSALELLDCNVSERHTGAVTLEVTCGGLKLTAVDEEGYRLTEDQLLVLTAFIELAGGTRALAVPYEAPAALEAMAADFGASILRVGRDGQRAEELYQAQTTLRDGIFAGARLGAYLKQTGIRLARLRTNIPRFSASVREVALKGDRGAAMRLMSSYVMGKQPQGAMTWEIAAGLRLDTDRGRVSISPLRERSALRIRTESMNEETAEELCAEFERRARDIDSK